MLLLFLSPPAPHPKHPSQTGTTGLVLDASAFLTLTSPAPQSVSGPASKGLKNLPSSLPPSCPSSLSPTPIQMDGTQASSLPICPSAPPAHMPPGSQKDFSKAHCPQGAPFSGSCCSPGRSQGPLGFTRSCLSLSHPYSPSFFVTPSLTSKGCLAVSDGASHNWEVSPCVIICWGLFPLACEFREGRAGRDFSPCGFQGLVQAWQRARAE